MINGVRYVRHFLADLRISAKEKGRSLSECAAFYVCVAAMFLLPAAVQMPEALLSVKPRHSNANEKVVYQQWADYLAPNLLLD